MTDTLEDYYLSLKAEDYEKESKEQIKWIPHKEVKNMYKLVYHPRVFKFLTKISKKEAKRIVEK